MKPNIFGTLLGALLLAAAAPAGAATLTGTGDLNAGGAIQVGDAPLAYDFAGANGISGGVYDPATTKHYYDYVFTFDVTGPAKATIQASGDTSDGAFSDFHAVLYDLSPIGSGLDSFVGNTHETFPDNVQYDGIDITGASPNPFNGASTSAGGKNVALSLASLSTGTYYLRLFGALEGGATLTALGGTFSLSAVSVAATPIPAALPLFISAMGVLGFAARRRKAAAVAA